MSDDFNYNVDIQWSSGGGSAERWDEVCIWAMENFGLPGEHYMTELVVECMRFKFKDDRNAFLMRLRFGEIVLRGNYATNN